mmetsp:Transcript_36066/g.83685  ORF Transcript_36066/g.83685 Transcript_36066/m.83685 type:complete len:216 (+) Transcript_36066:100-747(+)
MPTCHWRGPSKPTKHESQRSRHSLADAFVVSGEVCLELSKGVDQRLLLFFVHAFTLRLLQRRRLELGFHAVEKVSGFFVFLVHFLAQLLSSCQVSGGGLHPHVLARTHLGRTLSEMLHLLLEACLTNIQSSRALLCSLVGLFRSFHFLLHSLALGRFRSDLSDERPHLVHVLVNLGQRFNLLLELPGLPLGLVDLRRIPLQTVLQRTQILLGSLW